jgi:hypothetical protein
MRSKEFIAEILMNPPTNGSSAGMAAEMYADSIKNNAKEVSPLKIGGLATRVFEIHNGYRVFVLDNDTPILYLALPKFLDGLQSAAVAVEPMARGKGLAQKIYLAISDQFKLPIYSDLTQTDASRNGIWGKLLNKYPDRIVGYDQKTKQELPLTSTDAGPTVNKNQPIYTPNKKYYQQRDRTRLLKLLP